MKVRNKAVFALIFKLSIADDKFTASETKYLANTAKTLGISQSDVKEVTENPDAFELIPPASEPERMQILYYMLFAMRIDGEITKIEEEHVYRAGLKLGFNEIMVREMINLFKQHLDTKLPTDALLEIIKKYMN